MDRVSDGRARCGICETCAKGWRHSKRRYHAIVTELDVLVIRRGSPRR